MTKQPCIAVPEAPVTSAVMAGFRALRITSLSSACAVVGLEGGLDEVAVGLPAAAVRESQDRVRSASGYAPRPARLPSPAPLTCGLCNLMAPVDNVPVGLMAPGHLM